MNAEPQSPSSPEPTHQRTSTLYQYHNAPEVAPAHGLEFDDAVYPASDKFPVIREAPSYDMSNYKGKHAYAIDNRPPRIIFGMKIKTFLFVSLVMVLIIIGAAVGGAVGGKHMRENQSIDTTAEAEGNNETTSSTLAASTAASTYSAPTPTYTALSDCPQSNNTLYTSSYAGSGATGVEFTKYCDYANPLSHKGATTQAQVFVYAFNDCIDLCAGLNSNDGTVSTNCSVAVYMPNDNRPYNCAVGHHAADTSIRSLGAEKGTNVAFVSS
ncbi:hypothetical protein KC332_g8642 [Hortaea werneckii]|uniref:Apple domain-containing protein n=2 Tax=Hortaea werneckii TaxID=91943 RepID=A0A3M7JAI7_HORWE|nr:hypothetical protein KC358_g8474 [Hortaea werneckii]OTA32625.1 hypothetical protein BTJ68_07900 [Hortaea werneckii EXF-2000]KAI6829219.1 hypothetical protein KC350_g7906 [Hortaea werneckii]KAI6925800.1 hypothetical protein KC348_g8877 [Hortaea werneckii]KAI6933325.1 hypothetical protein KC341_g8360 [Hortaea werneckii]